MTALTRRARTALAAILLASLAAATAPSPAAAQPRQRGDAPWVAPVPGDPRLLDIDFPGGTLGEYLEGLGAVVPANFIPSPDAAKAPLQPIRARSVAAQTAVALPTALIPEIIYQGIGPDAHIYNDAGEPRPDRPVYTFSLDADVSNAQANAPTQPALFDLDFPGGNVEQYAAAIRRANPRANIVVAPEAQRFPMPAVSLKASTTEGAVAVAELMERQTAPGAFERTNVHRIKHAGPEVVYKIMVDRAGERPQKPESAAFSLGSLLSGDLGKPAKIEDVLSAVEAAMALFETPAVIKYHPETRLLLVRGDPEQIAQIQRVLAAIENNLLS